MIHPTAIIGKTAKIGDNVTIGPYAIISDDVTIGDKTVIGPHAVIEPYVEIGPECQIFQFASVGAVPQSLKFKGEISRTTMHHPGIRYHQPRHRRGWRMDQNRRWVFVDGLCPYRP